MAHDRLCPRCGWPLTDEDRPGSCPACLLLAGLEPDSREGGPLDASNGDQVTLGFESTNPGRVLESLARSIGSIPRVLLPDTANDDRGVAVIKPASTEMPTPAERGDRYLLFGEIARGGMGAVLKGRDPDLGRDLAVKVLLEGHRDKPDLLRRFVEEAQIGGQLQHPGIVPVYELGTFADSRPYFTMKLVKGRTLAQLLKERTEPGSDLPRFLGIFEQVCQTMAYAHARGVIHRDLKPSNIMVGGFGEVQVMDWGLAKVLREGGVADESPAPEASPPEASVIQTVRSGSDADASQAGSALGTPAYMAPEQAGGDIERVDRRADVFGLGSILCEVLTGQPAYTGRSQNEVLRKAMRGETADALSRLDGCAADAELIAIAKECLSVEPDDRPRDAGVVADRVADYLAGVQRRLHAAELARAQADARAEEERKRRHLQLGLATSIAVLAIFGGLAFTYEFHRRQALAARGDRLLSEVVLLRDLARERPEDVARWERARDAVARIDDPVALAPPGLAALRRQVQDGMEAAEADRDLLARLIDIRSARADDPDGSATDAAYASAFRTARIDPDGGDPAVAGAGVARRPPVVSEALVAALDEWAAVRRLRDPKGAGWRRPLAVAHAADPDPDRKALRDALLIEDKAERLGHLRPLVERADAESWAPASLMLLADFLAGAGDKAAGVAVLRRTAASHPADARVHHSLARLLSGMQPPQREEAIRSFSIARALQPELAGHELAHMLERSDRGDEAEAVWLDLIRRRPRVSDHLNCYVLHLFGWKLGAEASVLRDRAIAAMREEIRRENDDPWLLIAHYYTLKAEGKLDGEASAWREATRRRPDDAWAHANLGEILKAQQKYHEAIAEFREAIRLNPNMYLPHVEIGGCFWDRGMMAEAATAWRDALRIRPGDEGMKGNLGKALARMGKPEKAIPIYSELVRSHPGAHDLHYGLANCLNMLGKCDEAIAEFRKAIHLNPDFAEAHCGLGNALVSAGDYAGALAELRRGHELGSKRPGWPNLSAEWVRRAEQMVALEARLPAVLRDEAKPADAAEGLAFADMAYRSKRFAVSSRLYAEALGADPKRAKDPRSGQRYNAACAAALAGAGRGKDRPPNEAERMRWRKQAVAWLDADLASWRRQVEAGPPGVGAVATKVLLHWKQDGDLAAIRNPEALDKLPPEEQAACRKLWADVDDLIARMEGRTPEQR